MSYGEEQQKEIATIKKRNISLNLSDADIERIWKKAGSVGMSVSDLLENFIGDLVGGTYSNGSDERSLANEWFNRCGFGMFPENTFLRHLIEWANGVESVIELWDDIKTAKEELEYADTHKDEFTEASIQYWKDDLANSEEDLNYFFSEYQQMAKDKDIGTLEEEMEKIIKWHEEMKLMQDDEAIEQTVPECEDISS